MLPKRRNELTISVLSRLKDRGAPAPQIRPFPLLGEEKTDTEDQETDQPQQEQGDALDEQDGVQVTPPRRRKRPSSVEV